MPNISGLSVNSLSCANSSILPQAESSVPYLASFIATYTGGSGSVYSAQDVSSTGVTGLTAHLDSGTLNNGDGNLVYVITGTPTTTGTANFAISIGGKSCSFGIGVVEKGKGGSTACPTDYTNCTFKTVTLSAGETFVLPPGGEIVAVTDPDVLQSVNDCLDLTKIEIPSCYKTCFVETDSNLGGGTFDSGETPAYNMVYVQGIIVNGVNYPFSSNFGFNYTNGTQFANSLAAHLNTTPFGPIITNISVYFITNNNGEYYCFTFNTIKSIGDNLVFYGYAQGGNTGGGDFSIQFPAYACE